jgi:DNA-binding response OmpR family regulator
VHRKLSEDNKTKIIRIAILEDDPALAKELLDLFTSRGHSCYLRRSVEAISAFLSRETVDVLLLDLHVQGAPVVDLIRQVREGAPRHPPIVVLSNFSAEQDIIAALRAGADGYAMKPLQPDVLLARIEGLYERWYTTTHRSHVERYGAYEFHTASRKVMMCGTSIELTSKEFALALMLFRNQDRTLSRSLIFESLWGSNVEMQTRTVDSHVSKVRTKLDLKGAHGFRLLPVYGTGYRLDNLGHDDAVECADEEAQSKRT